MADLREKTQAYVDAFAARDLDGVATYMADDFRLSDPEVSNLMPKAPVLDYIKKLFDTYPDLSFVAHKIAVDSEVSVIHFTLTLGETVLDGVDFIIWGDGMMRAMDAYLTPRS